MCHAQHEFKDQYFDTPKFDLSLRDMWLRKRKGCWELKCPTTADGTEETSREQTKVSAAALCTRYKEITDLPEIQLRVRGVIEELCEDGEKSCSQKDGETWVSKLNLGCFAEFTTVRQSFTLERDEVQVDLDWADFGYSVGEIEVLVPEGGDVQSALEKIDRTARKLGELSTIKQPNAFYKHETFTIMHSIFYAGCSFVFLESCCLSFFPAGLTGDQRIEGKMSVYLKRNYPDHYAKLLSTHVL